MTLRTCAKTLAQKGKNEMAKQAGRPTTQTVRMNGKRVRLVTRNGLVTAKAALPLEWELQAAQVRALRALPEYGTRFLIAGDMNAAKRGPRAQMQAQATGMEPGEHDLRVYMAGGRLGLIENKVGRARLTPAQEERHPSLAALGFARQAVIRATSTDEAATMAVEQVREWLAENNSHNLQ